MTFLEKIRQNALNDPDRIVYRLESKSEQKGLVPFCSLLY